MTSAKRLAMMLAVVQFVFACPAIAEKWIYRGKYIDAVAAKAGVSVSSKGYLDVDSIRVEDGLIRYWTKDEIMADDKPAVVPLESRKSWAVNCKRRTLAWTATTVMGMDSYMHRYPGATWSESIPPEKWVFEEAPPGSRGAQEMDFVCKWNPSDVAADQPSSERSKRGPAQQPPRIKQQPSGTPNTSSSRTIRTGSGIVVSREGHVLTNNHVIKGCHSIRVWDPNKGQHSSVVVAGDQTNDLSLLKSDGRFDSAATFRGASPIRPGDAVVALGFPLAGLLASEVNVSIGNINAQAGLANDITKLQISVPVQPGNSGGPLLDEYGNVTGVVVQKLDAVKVWKLTGDIPQNVNFAVKGEIAQLFLGTHKISVQLGSATKKLEPAEIATRGRAFTVLIECLN